MAAGKGHKVVVKLLQSGGAVATAVLLLEREITAPADRSRPLAMTTIVSPIAARASGVVVEIVLLKSK